MDSRAGGSWGRSTPPSAAQTPWVILQSPHWVALPPPPPPLGHVKEGLLELLLLQNAQVHQLLLCRLAEGSLDPLLPVPNLQAGLVGQHEELEEAMGIQDERPLVFHHHYLPCLPPTLGPLLAWPASLLPPPPCRPHLQDTPRIQHHPLASRKRDK
ncbi:proline-rich protein 29 isoform X2 [Ochotona princeps]|nr:proline-rich protein 29 isoform X2 [Ochotona princeps]